MKDIIRFGVLAGLFMIPFLAVYVENGYFFPFITGKNFWFRIIVDVVLAGWVILALLDAQYRPRWSWLLGGFSALVLIMFFANLFGVHPSSSFWSNFERMDGYVTLVHVFGYFLVLSSMLKTKAMWTYYLQTSLVVAFFVGLFGLAQVGGLATSSSGTRIDSWLGNAAYLAIYMLFHIFVAFWLSVESKQKTARIGYLLLALLFAYVLFQTGTRGTFIGFIAGMITMGGYIALFGSKFVELRRYAIGAVVLVVVLVSGIFIARDTTFVQTNGSLSRIANINLGEDLTIRSKIWGLAVGGVQERPLLGYGQSNFNYVFNEKYDPFLFGQEQWFDRVHNIFFDWLVTGGVLGLLAYLSIFVACGYYLFLRPLLRPKDETFTVLERGVLLGVLVGYFTHNLVVFDNIVSYIFFGMVLALIHSRVAVIIPSLERLKVDRTLVTQLAAPAVGVALVATLYFVHMPSMAVASDIIAAFRAPTPEASLEAFEIALARESLIGRQELVEQLAQRAMGFVQSDEVSAETKALYRTRAEEELERLVAYKPNDARVHVFFGSFYRMLGELDKAAEQFARARELSPQKQSIIVQQALVALAQENPEQARDWLTEGLALDERNDEIREFLAIAHLSTGDEVAARELITSDTVRNRFAASDFLVSTANQANATGLLTELFLVRTEQDPQNAQSWATLAFLQYQANDIEAALTTLETASVAVPTFASTSRCIQNNLRAGNEPQLGCQ